MTKRRGKPDVRDVVDRVDEIPADIHDKAVRAILRWAARTNQGPTAALDMCKSLGLDLRAALIRSRASRGTRSTRNKRGTGR